LIFGAVRINTTYIPVSVEDSGIGINKLDQEKIFKRFYRVAGKNEKTYPGFGIALFICQDIIQRHGGKIGIKRTWKRISVCLLQKSPNDYCLILAL